MTGKSAGYTISRDKFFSESETKKLMKVSEEKAAMDQLKGRKTWITRYALVHIALYSGLRVSEIAGLKVGDLHISDKDPYLVVRHGKGGKKRDTYLDRELVKHLRKYIDQKRKTLDESVEPDAPVFAGRAGKHYTSTALEISFKQAVKAAGLPPTSHIHQCRHTYGTFLYAATKDLRYVQKQLGHSSPSMTAHYADVLPELNGKLANAILK